MRMLMRMRLRMRLRLRLCYECLRNALFCRIEAFVWDLIFLVLVLVLVMVMVVGEEWNVFFTRDCDG